MFWDIKEFDLFYFVTIVNLVEIYGIPFWIRKKYIVFK